MKKKFFIIGNWKMNGLRASRKEIEAILAARPPCDVMICPPATLIADFADMARGHPIRIGAQNCHPEKEGAHTGEISAEMLADSGAEAVLCGHSERRISHGESGALICAKARAALRADLMPIICIGESAAERSGNQAMSALSRQIADSVPSEAQSLALAYEPVWAIGSGAAAKPGDIQQAHRHIRHILDEIHGWDHQPAILYGGSVNPENAAAIAEIEEVDGLLIGGASLKASAFLSIINICRQFC